MDSELFISVCLKPYYHIMILNGGFVSQGSKKNYDMKIMRLGMQWLDSRKKTIASLGLQIYELFMCGEFCTMITCKRTNDMITCVLYQKDKKHEHVWCLFVNDSLCSIFAPYFTGSRFTNFFQLWVFLKPCWPMFFWDRKSVV